MSNILLPQLPTRVEKVVLEKFDEGLEEVDAQRIMSILEEVEKKLRLLSILPQIADKKEFRNAELKLNNQMTDNAQLTSIQDTQNQIKKITKNLYRHFSTNQTAMTKLHQITKNDHTPFLDCITQFKHIIYEKLKTSSEQESTDQNALEFIVSTEKKMREEIDQLKTKLNTLRETKEVSITGKNDLIDSLKEELRSIRKHAEDANKKLDVKSTAKETSDYTEFFEKNSKIIKEIATVKAAHIEQVTQNRDEESNMRKRKTKVEVEVENWLSKYDQDMGEKQVDIDELMGMYTDEQVQFDELKIRYDSLKVTYDGIQDEIQLARLKVQQEAELLERKIKACVKIQALFRGILARKALLQAKNKAKPKAKGKK